MSVRRSRAHIARKTILYNSYVKICWIPAIVLVVVGAGFISAYASGQQLIVECHKLEIREFAKTHKFYPEFRPRRYGEWPSAWLEKRNKWRKNHFGRNCLTGASQSGNLHLGNSVITIA